MTEEHNTEVSEQENPAVEEAPAKSVSDMVDEAYSQKPEESSPQSTETETPEDTGSEPDKTPKSEGESDQKEDVDSFKDVPEGFNNHPAWQKREQKLKEATDKAEKSEKEVSKYKEMLRDPVIYRRHLEKEGYSESKVNDLMREAGHPVTSPDHLETKEDIVERMCKQEGWNPKDLDESQNSQIKDLFGAVHRLIKSEMAAGIKSEVAPIKEKFDDVERQAQFSQDYEGVKKLAKDEFPEFDFDKEIEPAMISYLDMLDKKDPERTHKIPPEQVYKEATRTLLMDKAKASASKAERATKKQNARPLRPGASTKQATPMLKGSTVNETVDKYMNEIGWRE